MSNEGEGKMEKGGLLMNMIERKRETEVKVLSGGLLLIRCAGIVDCWEYVCFINDLITIMTIQLAYQNIHTIHQEDGTNK